MYNCAIAQNCTLCSLCPAPLQNQIAQLRKLVARVCRSLVHAHWTICLRNCATLTKPKQRPLALTASLSRHNTAQQLRICNNCAFAQFSTTRTQTVLCMSLICLSSICLSSICQSLLFCWPIAQLRNCAIGQSNWRGKGPRGPVGAHLFWRERWCSVLARQLRFCKWQIAPSSEPRP